MASNMPPNKTTPRGPERSVILPVTALILVYVTAYNVNANEISDLLQPKSCSIADRNIQLLYWTPYAMKRMAAAAATTTQP